jgi:hypothetical protein
MPKRHIGQESYGTNHPLTSALNGGEGLTPRLGLFTHGKKTGYPPNGRIWEKFCVINEIIDMSILVVIMSEFLILSPDFIKPITYLYVLILSCPSLQEITFIINRGWNKKVFYFWKFLKNMVRSSECSFPCYCDGNMVTQDQQELEPCENIRNRQK